MAPTVGFSRTPSLIISSAPPSSPWGAPSSAGWKMNLMFPLILSLTLTEDHRRAQGDRGVDVVAAGVHHSGVEGLEGDARRFLDGQGVHVRPDGHRRSGLAAAEQADDARPGDARLDLETEGRQLGGDELRRLVFPVAQLGVHVDEAADLDDLGPGLFDLLVDPEGRLLVHGQEPERGQGENAQANGESGSYFSWFHYFIPERGKIQEIPPKPPFYKGGRMQATGLNGKVLLALSPLCERGGASAIVPPL